MIYGEPVSIHSLCTFDRDDGSSYWFYFMREKCFWNVRRIRQINDWTQSAQVNYKIETKVKRERRQGYVRNLAESLLNLCRPSVFLCAHETFRTVERIIHEIRYFGSFDDIVDISDFSHNLAKITKTLYEDLGSALNICRSDKRSEQKFQRKMKHAVYVQCTILYVLQFSK